MDFFNINIYNLPKNHTGRIKFGLENRPFVKPPNFENYKRGRVSNNPFLYFNYAITDKRKTHYLDWEMLKDT